MHCYGSIILYAIEAGSLMIFLYFALHWQADRGSGPRAPVDPVRRPACAVKRKQEAFWYVFRGIWFFSDYFCAWYGATTGVTLHASSSASCFRVCLCVSLEYYMRSFQLLSYFLCVCVAARVCRCECVCVRAGKLRKFTAGPILKRLALLVLARTLPEDSMTKQMVC